MKHLESLGKKLSSFEKTDKLSAKDWEKIAKKTTIVLMAGGASSRFREVAGSAGVNKNAFKLPNGDTMIEMTVRMYRDAGITNFVALVRDEAESIREILGNGRKHQINLSYCFDPKPPAGKGGALRHAFEEGFLDDESYLVIHNPDDVILDFAGSFPRHILKTHLHGHRRGYSATVVVCEGTPHQYSAMRIQNGEVTEIEMYPFLPIPTHIGVTVFSPGMKKEFQALFDYAQKVDFEKTLFPKLSGAGRLYAAAVPYSSWIPVNNLKNYQLLISRLKI